VVDVLGIVMAGGKSSRFGREKLMAELNGRKIIDITVSNISSSSVGKWKVAVSPNAPLTLEYCRKYDCILTPGSGYPEDVKFLLEKLKRPLLLLNGDSVFIDPLTIDIFLSRFNGRSMTAVVKDGDVAVNIGLNIAVPGDTEDEIFEFKNPILALNINTTDDLRRAELIASDR